MEGFTARLNRVPRLGRMALCGMVTVMTMPLLSTLGVSLVPLVFIGVVIYIAGWVLWVGFEAGLKPVSAGAILYLVMGIAALLVWLIYHLLLLILVVPA